MFFECPFYVTDAKDPQKIKQSVDSFIQLIRLYENRENISIDYSGFLIGDLIRAFSRDVKKLITVDGIKTPNQFRLAGLIAFWIRKLKPLQKINEFKGRQTEEDKDFLHLFLNEQFALDVGLSLIDLRSFSTDVASFRKEIYRDSSDILTNLRYRAISPQAMAQFFKITVQLRDSQKETIDKLLLALEYRDDETGAHVKRIAEISYLLAEACPNIAPRLAQRIKRVAPMHDIGKIGVPDHVLRKKDKLNDDDWKAIKTHLICGSQILEKSNSRDLEMARNIALCHHERWDGTGYPKGLKGDDIPIEARIVALADSFDAMREDRVYRKALSEKECLEQILKGKGTQFDPALCDIFIFIGSRVTPRQDGRKISLTSRERNSTSAFLEQIVPETDAHSYRLKSKPQKGSSPYVPLTNGLVIFSRPMVDVGVSP